MDRTILIPTPLVSEYTDLLDKEGLEWHFWDPAVLMDKPPLYTEIQIDSHNTQKYIEIAKSLGIVLPTIVLNEEQREGWARRELYRGPQEDYVATSMCSACHETFYDSEHINYNFCPHCGVRFLPKIDTSKRRYNQPKWELRAKSLGIEFDEGFYLKETPHIQYLVEWENGSGWKEWDGLATSDRREALWRYRQCLDLVKMFTNASIRLAAYDCIRWCKVGTEPVGVALVKKF